MSFFIRSKSVKKSSSTRKRKGQSKQVLPRGKVSRKAKQDDEEIESDTDITSDEEDDGNDADFNLDVDETETAQDKRIRLAKQYIDRLKAEEADKALENEDPAQDAIAHRLRQDILEERGRHYRRIATTFLPPREDDLMVLRGHKLPITCLVITPGDDHVFSASKDSSIIKWCTRTGKKVKVISGGRRGTEDSCQGHTACVLSLAISSDGRYLASGDHNNLIHIRNAETCERIHIFKGHRGPVSGLAFRKGTHTLFSGSHDRSVKIWSLTEMTYVETLFGHEDVVQGIDALQRDRAVTCGGRDGSVRMWKVVEESQLVFHGHHGSIDTVTLCDEDHFLTGADDNSLALWSTMKKKPLCVVQRAHVCDTAPTVGSVGENWITAVAALYHTDLVASGSKDGNVRLWTCGRDFKSLDPLFTIPVLGFVNALRFSSDGGFLVVGVGQEHRLGRWWRIKEAKNAVHVVKLNRRVDNDTMAS